MEEIQRRSYEPWIVAMMLAIVPYSSYTPERIMPSILFPYNNSQLGMLLFLFNIIELLSQYLIHREHMHLVRLEH
jgi:hypothetical protein